MKLLFNVRDLKTIIKPVRVIIFMVVISIMSACTKTEDYLRDMFVKHSDFIDPNSVMFRNVTSHSDLWDIWCGEVNGKNRMGGYVGWKPFSVRVHASGKVYVTIVQPRASTGVKNAIENFYQSECRKTQPSSSWVPFWK